MPDITERLAMLNGLIETEHTARRLLRAVEAVLALHRRCGIYESEDACLDTDERHRREHHHEDADNVGEFYCDGLPVGVVCAECLNVFGERIDWPCPTVQAITSALGRDDE